MIDIKTTSNLIRFSTPINEGSKRKFLLMKEDYITLKFSLKEPIYFKLGDYVDDSRFGLFELCDLQKPSYNEGTAGYDYELRLDAYYWKWKNKKFKFTPETGGKEASWNLTASLDVQMGVLLRNLQALGYKYKGINFNFSIDSTVENSAKLMSYENMNLLDALTKMAEAWDCEWWVTDSIIHFGRCEHSDPVDFELGKNVERMTRSDSRTNFATRVYAFGSTRNIPANYRKSLVFDVKEISSIAGYRTAVMDSSRKLLPAYFKSDNLLTADLSTSSYVQTKEMDIPDRGGYQWNMTYSLTELSGSTYVIDFSEFSAYVTGFTSFSVNVSLGVILCTSISDESGKEIELAKLSFEGRKRVDVPVASFSKYTFKSSEKFFLKVFQRIRVRGTSIIKLERATGWCNGKFSYRKQGIAANTAITFTSGPSAGKTFDAVFNPEFRPDDDAASGVIAIKGIPAVTKGDRFTLSGLIRGKIPSSYFTSNIDEGMTVNGISQKRLMLPENMSYIDAYENMTTEEAVEGIIVYDDIYPRRTGSMSGVSIKEYTDKIENEDGTTTEKKWLAYRFKDTGITFSNEYILAGQELKITFQSGTLNGMEFAVTFNPDKKPEKSDDNTLNPDAQVWEIVRNEDYGRELPSDVLIPKNGDTYILSGFDTSFVSDAMIPAAEREVEEKARKDIERMKIDPSTYETTMMFDSVYGADGHNLYDTGARVNLVNAAYFETGNRQSRIIGFEYNLDMPHDLPVYTVGETASYSRIGDLEEKMDSLTYKGQTYTGNGGNGVYLIRTNDSTPATDSNAFSAKRAQIEFLSRVKEDNAFGLKTFEDGIVVKSAMTARQLKSALSDALSEPSDSNPEALSLSLTEEGDRNPEATSTALSEVALDGGFGGGTLGELENVDSTFDTLRPGKYGIEVKADGIIRPVPAASMGVGSRLTLTAKSELSVIALSGDNVILKYEFTSVDTSDESPTGAGTAHYNVNGVRVATVPIEQGVVSWDCTSHLIAGENSITVSVTDAYNVNRILTFYVQVVTLSISSTFDEYQPYTGDIQFRYTPVGAIAKNIIFKLDGTVIATVPTTSNNRQMTQVIPAQSHGAHILEVYIEAAVGDKTVRSNVLRYAVVSYALGNNTPIIASSFNVTGAEQYNTLSIPFFVYNPVASTASVLLKANGVVVSERVVDRTRQLWNYRADKAGSLTLSIAVGSVYKSFTVNVTASEIDVSAETEHLQLYLTAAGRSNSETSPSTWSNNGISASLTGFNFVNNGWIADAKGIVSLKVSGDARVAIPLKIFGDDFRLTGKTIEFELSTTDVVDYNAVVVSCLQGGRGIEITAQSASLRSEQSYINTRFKEDERVRVAFVVEDRTGSRLIYTYIDGVASGVIQYSTDDNFMQPKPADIVIGSNDCTVCIHNIRVYQAALNQFQMLDNCIADMDDMQTKIAMYARNQIFDSYGDVSYPKVIEQIPGLTIIGNLPTFKGDKKTVVMVYEDRQNPARSWRAENVQIDVQGTSSQYYPRKNFKVKCKSGFIMAATGETVAKVAIREGGIPVSVFCFKADFAESSGTHNTGMAKVVDQVLRAMNYLVPPQRLDTRVRTTVDGYPFTIFHRTTEASALEFVGKYNFNNDKSTQETFGFVGGMECWEIKNNTSDRVLFKTSDYTMLDAEGNPDWLNDFEARYPDDDDLNAEYEAGKIPVNLKRLTDWLVSTIGNPAKFKAEASQYLDVDFLLSYYSITELFAMVDQRAKNMFLTTYDGVHWIPIFYDNDTCLGVNNEGAVAFGYDVEYHDTEGSGQVWNGEQSVLWNNVEAAYLSEITAMYQTMRSSGAISYDMCIGELNSEQSDKWCEAIYNADGKFKYIDPLLNEGNGSYLYALQGSRSQHRKWWLYNRFRYIDSKYVAGDFKNDYVTMRLYTPSVWQGVKPNADFTLTPAGDVYVAVKYGSYIISKRGHKDVPIVIKAPEIAFNDTETIVYGAAYIGSLGDLSAMYPGTVDISKATKLTELIVGSGAVGYQNNNLTVLAIGNNTLFRRLNVMNCNKLTQPIDVSGCENIEEIYAQGTSITSVKLPTAGRLSQLYLPDTITSLTIRNQTLTEDGFELAGVKSLSTVYIENTNGVDSATLINKCLASSSPVLERIRLIGVDWRLNSLDVLVKLSKLKGLDVNGMNTNKSVITGKCHVLVATSVKLAEMQAAFPELTITYSQLKPETVTTFVFGSSQSKSITNAVFECNFDYTKVSETTYKITAQDGETIVFTFKCDNHVDYSNSYYVAGTRTQSYTVKYIPLRTIRVKVYGQYIYPQGASVVINGKKHTTDANGYVTYRGGDAVSGTVEAFGYAGNTFSFSVITSDTTHTIDIYAAVEVKFTVKFGTSLVQGATIQCGAEQGVTNIYGECVLMLGKGTYNYTVSKYGYFDVVGEISVGTSATSKAISLKLNAEQLKPAENGNIQMYIDSAGASITINATSARHVIDWGDGTESIATGATGNVVYSHTYQSEGMYQVEVKSCEDITACNADKGCLIAYWSVGNSKVNGLSFTNYSKLCYVGLVFKNDGARTSFGSCFQSCGSLTSIPAGLFDNCTVVTNFNYCFYYCSNLTSIPTGLFDNCTVVTNFNYCFYYCSNLTSIPTGLFDNCTVVTSFSSCFSDCRTLTSVPAGLFDNCTVVTNFNYCFYSCGNLTSLLPQLWVQYHGKQVSKSYCFSGCTKAANWSDVPTSWGGTAPEYVPPVSVSGVMMADYRALEMRIRNIEIERNMDKN